MFFDSFSSFIQMGNHGFLCVAVLRHLCRNNDGEFYFTHAHTQKK